MSLIVLIIIAKYWLWIVFRNWLLIRYSRIRSSTKMWLMLSVLFLLSKHLKNFKFPIVKWYKFNSIGIWHNNSWQEIYILVICWFLELVCFWGLDCLLWLVCFVVVFSSDFLLVKKLNLLTLYQVELLAEIFIPILILILLRLL